MPRESKKDKNLEEITYDGKALYLAYDQGLEHGPRDFDDKNVDPSYIIDIAKQGELNGVIFQKGIAEAYKKEIKKSGVPLIVKLNGKTQLSGGDPYSTQLCTVKEAVSFGATAVGYTIYIGSIHEAKMLEEFEEIQREAHKEGLPVIVWIYPRGKSIKKTSSGKLMAYAARVGLEIGADMIKIKYNGRPEDLKWAVKSAGKTKVLIAGGTKRMKSFFLNDVKEIMQSGARGMAIGRNIWQDKNPVEVTEQVKHIIFGRKSSKKN